MRNKILFFLILFTLVFSSNSLAETTFIIGFGAGHYTINDSLYKSIYGGGNPMFNAHLGIVPLKFLEIRSEVGFFSDRGKMTLSEEELGFFLRSLSGGIRLNLNVKKFNPYAGIGIVRLSTKEDYPERFDDVSRRGNGFYVETGTYFAFHRFYADLNFSVIDAGVKSPSQEELSLGGFKVGISVGYRFEVKL